MAIWEQPEILSGYSQAINKDAKADLALCIIHTGLVTTEWAVRFKYMQFPTHTYFFNKNQPYDTAREMVTRAALEQNTKYIFMLDTDVLAPINTIPVLIQWAEQFNLPILSGLYWAKKPGPPMPAAWIKINEKDPEHPEFAPLDIKPHMAAQTIVPADVTGAGCMLIKTDVFRQLEKSNPNLPFWQWGLGRKGLMQTSEDFYFCLRCIKELNIHPHVATAVQCDHISTCIRRGSDGEFELSMSV
jgi:hypothetical protein